jgi:hypothetical protein
MMTTGIRSLALYLVAAAAYVTLGVFFPKILLSWVEGTGFLLLAIWILPALARLRR